MQTLCMCTTRVLLEACCCWKTQLSLCHFSHGCQWSGFCTYVHVYNVRNIHNNSTCYYQTLSLPNCANVKKHTNLIKAASEHFDEQFTPALHCAIHYTPAAERLVTEGVVAGKGPPPEAPVHCCMSGCANCVWIAYAEALKDYYSDGGDSAKLAIENIDNPSLKMFVKLELGLM